jgi:hypothetical protein
MPKARATDRRLADLAGAPPKLATLDDMTLPTSIKSGTKHAQQRTSKKPFGINLKMVSEALIEEGMDPTLEMIRILKKEVPVLDANGKPRKDSSGKPMMRSALDDDTKLRTLNELLQYTQPKLKSVEMKLSGNLELTSEQLDNRLAMLLAKAAK